MKRDGRYGRALFGAGSVITLLLGVFFMSRNTERSPSWLGTTANAPFVQAPKISPAISRNAPGIAATETPSDGATGEREARDGGVGGESSESATNVALSAPTTSRLRDELGRNPERTPESLVRFSREVRARTDRALESPGSDESELLFGELERCVTASEVSPQAQVICVSNADRLASRTPLLASRASALRTMLSPEARVVLDFYHGMKKAPSR